MSNKNVAMGKIAMYNSLLRSIREAGGSTDSLMVDIEAGMSVCELIDRLGQNGVRFCTESNEE